MNVVVVESPAKARTINRYLGDGYTVLASYGHVRDLPAKDGSVRPDDDFAMVWETHPRAQKPIGDIVRALKHSRRLFLATDPDREGEAISWHVRAELERRKALRGVDVSRVVFTEVTGQAVRDAFAKPRDLDDALVQAYLARRALDYLVGFSISPVLWRKLPGSRSAGRVQSVALRLVCDREAEIEAFRAREYWTVDARLLTAAGRPFTARLTHLDGRKLNKLSLGDAEAATRAAKILETGEYEVEKVDRKAVKRHPSPPFITSTLQQEASRKLRFSATRTMQLAQQLYEGVDVGGETAGLITYMRTDGVHISGDAVGAIRAGIKGSFGERYLPARPRVYRSKAKNAQEAHEAIRPTDVARTPDSLRGLKPDLLKLYRLIWVRAMASQMASAEIDQTGVTIGLHDGRAALRASGSVTKFDGFLKLYQEDRDDPGEDEAQANRELPPMAGRDVRTVLDSVEQDGQPGELPPMAEGEALTKIAVTPTQHFTQPPPRYGEASLVKQLEELGIGRPSTYAAILKVLQDRAYVRLEKRRFVPEDRGRLVTSFLGSFFPRYVEYDFTAELEARLDEVSAGARDWKALLRDFWAAFHHTVQEAMGLRIRDVLDALDKELPAHFFPATAEGGPDRRCPACGEGVLGLRSGKFGAFLGCSGYPQCRHTRPLAMTPDKAEAEADAADGAPADGPRPLGPDPATGRDVSLRHGPYGFYVQREAGEGEKKPKRASLPSGLAPDALTLDQALGLLSLPRDVGAHPEGGGMITAGLGPFGPYLKHGVDYVSIPRGDDVLAIGLNRAVDLIAEAARKRPPAREIGQHGGKPVIVKPGRWGPFVQTGTRKAQLPKGTEMADVTLEQALALLDAKAAQKPKQKKPAGAAAGSTGKAAARPRSRRRAGSAAPPEAAGG